MSEYFFALSPKSISYQGIEGSYSYSIAKKIAPEAILNGVLTFEEALEAVTSGACDMTVIPIENNIGGRVAEIHHLLLNTKLKIIAEYCLLIEHCLLVCPGSNLREVENVYSHPQALRQCRQFILQHNLHPIVELDTAVAAQRIARCGNRTTAAIASTNCADIYHLDIAQKNIANDQNNITRFIVMSRKEDLNVKHEQPITALLFRLRSVPAALYKAIGGFAAGGINILKLESYIDPFGQESAYFYIEIATDINTPSSFHALEELQRFTDQVQILGVFEQNRSILNATQTSI